LFTRRLLIFSLIFCGLALLASAQRPEDKTAQLQPKASSSNLHLRIVRVRPGIVKIDSVSIIPKTFSIIGIPDSFYVLDYVNATLTWKQKPNQDSVLVSYRSFPFMLNAEVKRLNYDSIRNNFLIQPALYANSQQQGKDNFFNFGNIVYNGSFGRAISFGNSQDAVVTSNLNLQISGWLADSIEISAAITDNNIPIQPDGTTADLNDFDKIFLQFKKKNWSLSMGDIDLRQNQNYFLNFYKRLQGATFETTSHVSSNITNKTLVSAAIAKGKFNRNIFQGQEGNQGPYHLQGANNELFFIVLAGTEKVYIDGQMLQRGEDQDYVINYNTAELTFTQKRMITQDSRIQVEFEYSDQNYLNVNLYLFDEANFNNKLKIRMAVFSNTDSRNSPINQTLNPDQDKFLNQLGDSINKAFYPSAPIDTLAAGKILYQKDDTVYRSANGLYVHDSVYVFSVNPSVTLYNLSFVDVGLGNGDYMPNLNGVNGSVYQWVAPVNGQKQGQFEAAQFLVTPKTQQVVTIGADYALNKNTSLSGDFARSHYDVNTLSSLDKANDNGSAARVQLKNIHPFQSSPIGLLLTTNLSYEYAQASFQPLEPLRPVEFARDWGLSLQPGPANETLFSAAFQLSDKKKNALKYEFSGYDRTGSFTGIRNSISHTQEFGGWRVNDQVSLALMDSSTNRGYYLRPSLEISKRLTWLSNYTAGAGYSLEHNESKNKITDTVSVTSFAFKTFQVFLKSPEKDPNHWGLSYTTRDNSYPYGKALVLGDRSQTVNVFAEVNKNKHHRFRFNATFRNLEIINASVNAQQPDKTVLGRAEYIVNVWKGLLIGNALYELGAGQEQKKAFSYLQVPAGTGQYTWIDYNKDGVQQLNEFVLAQFPDQATFIRVYTPTGDYVKANYNTFNYSININPRAFFDPAKSKGMAKFMGKINIQSSMQLNQKEQASGLARFNSFKSPLNDTSLITRTAILSNTFSFNKSSTKWGFDINNSRNSSKTLLTYGYQSQSLDQWTARTRLNLNRNLAWTTTLKTGTSQLLNTSSNFDSSNYNLKQFSVEPDIIYTRGSNLRVTVGYKYSDKVNAQVFGGETYTAQSLNTEVKYNILQNTSLISKFSFSKIDYTGSSSSTVSYTMLEGLLPGNNYEWGLDFTKKLGNNLELSLEYDGRKPGEGSIINTGRASLRAIL
jgi:hypothetical protein